MNPVSIDIVPFSRHSSFDVVLLSVDNSRIVVILRVLVYFFVGNPVGIVRQPGSIIVRIISLLPVSITLYMVGVGGYSVGLTVVYSSTMSSPSTIAFSAYSTLYIVD